MNDIKSVFSIHFHGKEVYVGSTFYTFEEKIKRIKNDKDHILYTRLRDVKNPQIKEEGYSNSISEKEVARRYINDSYKIININLLPYNYKKNLTSSNNI